MALQILGRIVSKRPGTGRPVHARGIPWRAPRRQAQCVTVGGVQPAPAVRLTIGPVAAARARQPRGPAGRPRAAPHQLQYFATQRDGCRARVFRQRVARGSARQRRGSRQPHAHRLPTPAVQPQWHGLFTNPAPRRRRRARRRLHPSYSRWCLERKTSRRQRGEHVACQPRRCLRQGQGTRFAAWWAGSRAWG